MPTNPTAPNSNASVDRLTLGVDSPRGTIPSVAGASNCYMNCFEASASAVIFGCYGAACFDAGASSLLCGVGHCACFEMED